MVEKLVWRYYSAGLFLIGEVMDSEQKDLEIAKVVRENGRHLSLLASGTIVMLVSFVSDLFENATSKNFVFFAFFLLLVTILSSVTSIAIAPGNMRNDESAKMIGGVGLLVALLSYLGALICLALFLYQNWQ